MWEGGELTSTPLPLQHFAAFFSGWSGPTGCNDMPTATRASHFSEREELREASERAPRLLGALLATCASARRRSGAMVVRNDAHDYTFGIGPLGITVHEVRGGTRIAIESVAEDSQAEKLGIPVGGLLMAVNGQHALGMRLPAVRKKLLESSRPLTLMILSDFDPNAAVEVEAEPTTTTSVAAPSKASLLEKGLRMRSLTFGQGPTGFLLEDAEAGGGVVVVSEILPDTPAAAQGLEVGSVVVAVNETEVLGWGKMPVVHLLGKCRRPLALHVAVTPPPEPTSLTYTFGPGSMGLTLGDAPSGSTSIDDVAKGSPAAQQGCTPGGLLVALNDTPLAGISHSQVVRMIGKSKRPLTLSVLPGAAPVAGSDAAKEEGDDGKDEEEQRARERRAAKQEQDDIRRLLEERRASRIAKRMTQRDPRGDHQGAQGVLKAKREAMQAATEEAHRALAEGRGVPRTSRSTTRGTARGTSRGAKSTRRGKSAKGQRRGWMAEAFATDRKAEAAAHASALDEAGASSEDDGRAVGEGHGGGAGAGGSATDDGSPAADKAAAMRRASQTKATAAATAAAAAAAAHAAAAAAAAQQQQYANGRSAAGHASTGTGTGRDVGTERDGLRAATGRGRRGGLLMAPSYDMDGGGGLSRLARPKFTARPRKEKHKVARTTRAPKPTSTTSASAELSAHGARSTAACLAAARQGRLPCRCPSRPLALQLSQRRCPFARLKLRAHLTSPSRLALRLRVARADRVGCLLDGAAGG